MLCRRSPNAAQLKAVLPQGEWHGSRSTVLVHLTTRYAVWSNIARRWLGRDAPPHRRSVGIRPGRRAAGQTSAGRAPRPHHANESGEADERRTERPWLIRTSTTRARAPPALRGRGVPRRPRNGGDPRAGGQPLPAGSSTCGPLAPSPSALRSSPSSSSSSSRSTGPTCGRTSWVRTSGSFSRRWRSTTSPSPSAEPDGASSWRGPGPRSASSRATEILFLSWFVNCLVPAKLGDLYRAWLLKGNYGGSASRTVGTVFIERIADIIVIFGAGARGGLLELPRAEPIGRRHALPDRLRGRPRPGALRGGPALLRDAGHAASFPSGFVSSTSGSMKAQPVPSRRGPFRSSWSSR